MLQKYNGENVLVDETILNATHLLGSKNKEDIKGNQKNLSNSTYFKLVNDKVDKIVHFDKL
ncbi:MAG: hypothetical protein SO253_06235 [Bacilli bacterium]|nr:hypothetical protein [Bacilli bacterium]